jgi:hypothetical protein
MTKKKNTRRRLKSGQIKKLFNTHMPIVEYALHLFYKIFCKVCGLARRGFLALGGQPEAGFFQTYTKTIPGS